MDTGEGRESFRKDFPGMVVLICDMRKILTYVFLLSAATAGAQTIRISGFAPAPDDARAYESLYDTDGEPWSVLWMETGESGWAFEAGLDGIMDVQYGKGCIYVYVPAGTRRITVSREGCTPLRDWALPLSLEPGRTYRMRLECVPAEKARSAAESGKTFSRHFADAWIGPVTGKGGFTGETFAGLRYSYIQYRVGPYIAAGLSTDGGNSFWVGGAFRFTRPERSDLDFQAYGGVGLVYGNRVGGEAGIRFGWKSRRKLSGLDFGVGCQVFRGGVAPTVEVGLYIWGVPVVCGLCLLLVKR